MFRFRFETENCISEVITGVIIVIEVIRKIGKVRGKRILDVADGDAMGVTLSRLRGKNAAPYQGQGFPQRRRSIGLCRIEKENTVIDMYGKLNKIGLERVPAPSKYRRWTNSCGCQTS
jgi:hypothetical protein